VKQKGPAAGGRHGNGGERVVRKVMENGWRRRRWLLILILDMNGENDWGQRMASGRIDDFESIMTYCADLWSRSDEVSVSRRVWTQKSASKHVALVDVVGGAVNVSTRMLMCRCQWLRGC
jgi:hypothetical protein